MHRPKLLTLRILAVVVAALALSIGAFVLIDDEKPQAAGAKAAERAEAAKGPVTYTDLQKAIAARQVERAELSLVRGEAKVELADGRKAEVGIPAEDRALADRLVRAGAEVEIRTGENEMPLAAKIALGLLLLSVVAFAILAARRQRRHAHGLVDKSGGVGEITGDEIPAVRFTDVAGCDEAVEEVRELVDFLKRPERYRSLGASIPSGVILHGPPGTGKTLLAKALAGEAGVPYFSASGSDFVEMYVGVGSRRIRDLFDRARDSEQGAVIFIDEIDAVGKARGGPSSGANDEREQTLNQLLVELDGFTGRERVIVVAATNRLDTLDPALLRPGRLSRHIHVGVPSEEGRRAILAVHAASKPLAGDVDLARLAEMTAGASGAELAEMLNEGAIMAARVGSEEIRHADLWEGFLRVVAGPRKASAMLANGERERIAFHEAGHVLCAELCESCDDTLHATINPRGEAAGFAVSGRRDRALETEAQIREQLIHILGGRAAEYVVYGTVSSGASNDLQKANAIARRAVEELGLSPALGQVVSGRGGLSEEMRAVVDQEVRRMVEDAYRAAVSLVRAHRVQLDRLTDALLTAGDIDRLEIIAAMEGSEPPPRAAGPSPAPVEVPVPEPVELDDPVPAPRAVRPFRDEPEGDGSAVPA